MTATCQSAGDRSTTVCKNTVAADTIEGYKAILGLLPGRYAVCRLESGDSPPTWARGGFVSLTRTPDELSVVCAEESVPAAARCERGWRCLKVLGPLDFALTGVLAALAAPLAKANVSIFAISTYDTDYLLLPDASLERAVAALTGAGHEVTSDP